MQLLHLLYATAAFIICNCCIYYMRLLHDCYIYYMGLLHLYMRLLHLLYATAAFIICNCCIYYMQLLHLLYATATYMICDCCIYYMTLLHLYISGTYTNVCAAFVYATTSFAICTCCIYIWGTCISYAPSAFIYVFIYDVRAICINFDTNGTPYSYSFDLCAKNYKIICRSIEASLVSLADPDPEGDLAIFTVQSCFDLTKISWCSK